MQDKRKLRLKVSTPQPTAGTLEWLLQRAHLVRIEERDDVVGPRREALLLDQNGRSLARLGAVVVIARSPEEPPRLRHLLGDRDASGIPWTDAAWSLIVRIARKVLTRMNEPANLADAVRITLSPTNHREEQCQHACQADRHPSGTTRGDRDKPSPLAKAALEEEPDLVPRGKPDARALEEVPF